VLRCGATLKAIEALFYRQYFDRAISRDLNIDENRIGVGRFMPPARTDRDKPGWAVLFHRSHYWIA